MMINKHILIVSRGSKILEFANMSGLPSMRGTWDLELGTPCEPAFRSPISHFRVWRPSSVFALLSFTFLSVWLRFAICCAAIVAEFAAVAARRGVSQGPTDTMASRFWTQNVSVTRLNDGLCCNAPAEGTEQGLDLL